MMATPDLGSVVFFEHVNLRVTDHRLATAFFVEGLGLTRDPFRMVGTRNMWVNVGRQQFHLPIGEPTTLHGEVGVVLPDLETTATRLEALGPVLRDTAFGVRRDDGTLVTTTPWGHRMRLHAAGPSWGLAPQAVAYVEFWVAAETASTIAAFYRDVLQCSVEVEGPRGRAVAVVAVGPHQHFRFQERPDGRLIPSNNHVAVYLTRFHQIYAALEKLGVIMEPEAGEQFRFADIVDPVTGQRVYSFEHEMRSLYHPDYRRPLVNRTPVPYRVD
jgi:hypothetical protein